MITDEDFTLNRSTTLLPKLIVSQTDTAISWTIICSATAASQRRHWRA